MTLRRIPVFKLKTNEEKYNDRINYLKNSQKLQSLNKEALLLPDDSGFYKQPMAPPEFLIRDLDAEIKDVDEDTLTKYKKKFRDEMLKLAPLTIVDSILANEYYDDNIIARLMTLWGKFKKDLLKNFSVIDINTFNEYVKEYLSSDKIAVKSIVKTSEENIKKILNTIKEKIKLLKQQAILKKNKNKIIQQEKFKKYILAVKKNESEIKMKLIEIRNTKDENEKKKLESELIKKEDQLININEEIQNVFDTALNTVLNTKKNSEQGNDDQVVITDDIQEKINKNIIEPSNKDLRAEEKKNKNERNKRKSEDLTTQMMIPLNEMMIPLKEINKKFVKKEELPQKELQKELPKEELQKEKLQKEKILKFITNKYYDSLNSEIENININNKEVKREKYNIPIYKDANKTEKNNIPEIKEFINNLKKDNKMKQEYIDKYIADRVKDKDDLPIQPFYSKYPIDIFGEGLKNKKNLKNTKRYELLKKQILSGNDNKLLLKEIKKYK